MTNMNNPTPAPPTGKALVPDFAAAPNRTRPSLEIRVEDLTKLLNSLANNAWKIQGRVMVNRKGEEIRDELKKDDIKKLVRHLDSIFEALTEFGFEVRDRTGENYDYGLPERIVSSAPRAGLTKELIVETLKPTIYLNSHLIQAGEVVIAVPAEQKAEEK
jgi:hypothetical protein